MDDSLTSSSNLPGSAAWAVALQFVAHALRIASTESAENLFF